MDKILNFHQWANHIKLNENIQAAKSYLIKKYIEKNKITDLSSEQEKEAISNRDYQKILDLLKSNHGYVYAFVRFYFEHEASINDLKELYQKIKDNSGSLNLLPMSIEEYSNQDMVNGVNPFEALGDALNNIETRRKHKWIIEKVNGDLRRNIKTLNTEKLDRLYKAAQIIDTADAEAGDFEDPETGKITNNRISLLKKSNAFNNAEKYLTWVEEIADGVSNSDLRSKINALRTLEPEAGILYNNKGYLVLAIRTEKAQKELCSVANWCINRGSWFTYGGQSEAIQINIFNFNEPVTSPMHITGTTITNNRVSHSHDKNDLSIVKSSDPASHFAELGYPDDLVKKIVLDIPQEITIKKIVTGLGINSSSPMELLTSLVKSIYKIDADTEKNIINIIIGIIRDQISTKLSRENILDSFMKVGILSPFSARILNILIPNLTDSEKTQLINNNDTLINDPIKGLKVILSRVGTSAYPILTNTVKNEEIIKEIVISGDSITDDGF